MKDYKKLAQELEEWLPKHPMESLHPTIWGDEDYIYIAPKGGFCSDYVTYIEEIVTFAKYYDLDLHTHNFETGAGITLS